MCNCGNKRTALSQAESGGMNEGNKTPANTGVTNTGFEYTGRTALTVTGSVTGTTYRFSYPGNRQNIDRRDVPGMTAIPVLRRVS